MVWLTILLLTFHLLCVNLAIAGPLVCMFCEWREGRGNLAAGRAGRDLAKASILALLLGAATGVLLGWLRWNPEFRDALVQLERKLRFGAIEIVFSLVLMAWHWWWWRGPESRARWGRQIVLLLAGTNLLYHFPTLFAILSYVQNAAEPVVDGGAISAADFRQLLAAPAVLAQAVHVAVACFAVAGVWLIWRAGRQSSPEDQATGRLGAAVALGATILQLPVGIWLTISYPARAQKQLMGGDMIATLGFVASLLGALALMHHLAAVTFRPDPGKSRTVSVALTIALVGTMTAVLWLSRS